MKYPKLKALLLHLRPIEILGLSFTVLMIILYQWLDIPLFYPKRLLFWAVLVLLVFVISSFFRLIFHGGVRKTFHPRVLKKFARDWAPLVLFILVYDNLHDITRRINPYTFDDFFIAVDQVLFFGTHPTVFLEQFISPYLTGWLSINYTLYFLYFPLTLGLLYYKEKDREFHITSFTVMLTIYTGFILYLLFPCVGPILAQRDLHTLDIYGGTSFDVYYKVVELYGKYRDYFHCFPSLHFAVTAVFWFFSWKYMRPLFYIYTPFILSLWFSTVYLRWHYVVDLLAGAVVAGYAIFLGPLIYERWEKWRAKN